MAETTSIEWTGRQLGVMKTAAVRVGLSLEDYVARVQSGQKWCWSCKAWHPIDAFVVDRARGDGRSARCLSSNRGRPRGSRDPEREEARRVVAYAVRRRRIPRPDELACTDCGHSGADRRHEYDHHLGYAPEHRLDVEPVCTLCHADREKARRA